jgi:hypothetical protein
MTAPTQALKKAITANGRQSAPSIIGIVLEATTAM